MVNHRLTTVSILLSLHWCVCHARDILRFLSDFSRLWCEKRCILLSDFSFSLLRLVRWFGWSSDTEIATFDQRTCACVCVASRCKTRGSRLCPAGVPYVCPGQGLMQAWENMSVLFMSKFLHCIFPVEFISHCLECHRLCFDDVHTLSTSTSPYQESYFFNLFLHKTWVKWDFSDWGFQTR